MASVQLAPSIGGYAVYRNIDTQNGNGPVVSATEAVLGGWSITNLAAAVRHVKLYDKATAATASDTPKMTISLSANSQRDVVAPVGIHFTAGISIRATTAVADADNTAPTANDVVVNLYYRTQT